MDLLYVVWITLIIIGVVLGLILILKEKLTGDTTPKKKRELLGNLFFTLVMLVISILTLTNNEYSAIAPLFVVLFILGIFLSIRAKRA